VHGRFRCVGGVDVSKSAIADFSKLAGVPGTVLDLFSREQYVAFHGHEPAPEWREATPADIQRASHGERPHIGFGSAPCKGFSGLLSESRSQSTKYQALNQLALRGLWLALEAWKDDPLEFWLWENVPRIATRGRAVLDQMIHLYEAYGYVVAETTHDCGELGGLGQSRKRFLLVARHRDKVPPFLYEPPKRPLRSVGEVIGRLPVPGANLVLPMHRLPSLKWPTWVRLAFVEAGKDWRSLNRLRVTAGMLQDFRLAPDVAYHNGALGVRPWDAPAGTVTANGRPASGQFSVADPRIDGHEKSVQMGVGLWDQPAAVIKGDVSVGTGRYAVADPRYGDARNGRLGVRGWNQPAHVVAGDSLPSNGAHAVADPRPHGAWNWSEGRRGLGVLPWDAAGGTVTSQAGPNQGAFSVADPRIHNARFNHCYRIVKWEDAAPAVTSANGGTGAAVADPRPGYSDSAHRNKFAVSEWDEASGTVTGANHVTGGAMCVADPRPAYARDGKDVYTTTGEYGVVPWNAASGAVTAAAGHDNGRWSVADPRERSAGETCATSTQIALPGANDRLVAIIRALDGTFHRPFTTLELAALQSLVDPDEILQLHGTSDSAWRERIGNAVPPDAAEAIASVMGTTLLLAWSGETFALSATPVWVRPIAIAISVKSEAFA
jgi:site-specific DNA-cytosine methylase